ncbi:MAG: CPBP family intramembrane metalloprotease [Chitinophagaceae bacterium]|nr:CPBP family intramembrane metalloprotease [Chitinophagaceae bacterium]
MASDGNSKNISYPAQLGILLGLFGAGLILGSLVSGLIWMMWTGRSIFAMQSELLSAENYYIAMVIQGVSTFFIFFLPAVSFAMICYKRASLFLGTNVRTSQKQILLIFGLLVLSFPLGGALAEINQIIPIPHEWEVKFKEWEASREAQEAALIKIDTLGKYLMSMIIIAILPAIFEEFFFRGALQNMFMRWLRGPMAAIIVTAVIFSAVHASYYGFLVRFALGIILGIVYYQSGSIWLSAFFHFLFNGIQVTALYLFRNNEAINSKDIEQNFPLWTGAIALVLMILLFRMFKKESDRLKPEPEPLVEQDDFGFSSDYYNNPGEL